MSSQIKPEIREMVTNPLNEISAKTGNSSYQVFSDFLDLTISSFSGDERQYSTQIERYRTDGHDMATVKNLLQLHAKALSGLVVGLELLYEENEPGFWFAKDELHIQVGETSVPHPPIRCDLCGQATSDVESHLLGECPVLQD